MKSNTVQLEELPYRQDSCDWYERIRQLPCPLFLDSSHPHSRLGRFDVLAADPLESHIFTSSGSSCSIDIRGYFLELEESHRRSCQGLVGHSDTLPFCGGLAGCLDYGLGKPLQYLGAESGTVARVYLYGWAIVQDHLLRRCTLATLPTLDQSRRRELHARLREPVTAPDSDAPFQLLDRFEADLDPQAYGEAFRRIQSYIQAGDCYQVNLARRFSAPFGGDPWKAYKLLRPLAAAPFSAYLDSGDRQLLCLSPERFLRLSGNHVETRPIKGTRPRHRDRAADRRAAEELRQSTKDRAENLMIVDLLRNDIGRNCTPGTVQGERLFELESYPTVHHLVSTISGKLAPHASGLDLLRDCFPGGSITGAPKRRAMEIIEELETGARQAYCGSIFYLGSDGRLDSNIAIRSLLCEQGTMHCWGGGGIVADSLCEQEHQETWHKVGRFIEALESSAMRPAPPA